MQPEILLVADDSAARALLQETLAEAGYVVTEVDDSATALDLLRLNLTRKRPHRLVVLLNMASREKDVTNFLRAIPDDARVALHHAYVLLIPAESPMFQVDARSVPGLSISELRQPCAPEAVRAVVADAASQLGMGADGAGRRD
jgi:CheY-like chemotaxis protein